MLEKETLGPGLEPIASSSTEATERIKATSRSSATTTGAIFVGLQLPYEFGRVSELGTDKPEVENSQGLGAAVRVDAAICFAPLRSAVFFSLRTLL